MKIKSCLKYFIYIILVFILVVLKEQADKLFLESYYRYESPPIFYYAVIGLVLGVSIGLFLGIEHFIRELGIEGTWIINFPKLIISGLPLFYLSLSNILLFSGIQFIREFIAYPLQYLYRYGTGIVTIMQIILGYVVITSFYKDNDMK